jgi:hypothetical protein
MVPALRRMVVFDQTTGQPVVQAVPMFTREQVADIIVAAATDLYDADAVLEPEFVGKTNLEVMVLKRTRRAARSGDMDEVESLLDRIVGKPKTTAEVTKKVITYEDALREIQRRAPAPARAEEQPIQEAQVVDDSPLADIL